MGRFYLLDIANNAATVNVVVQLSAQIPTFTSFGYIPRSGTDG